MSSAEHAARDASRGALPTSSHRRADSYRRRGRFLSLHPRSRFVSLFLDDDAAQESQDWISVPARVQQSFEVRQAVPREGATIPNAPAAKTTRTRADPNGPSAPTRESTPSPSPSTPPPSIAQEPRCPSPRPQTVIRRRRVAPLCRDSLGYTIAPSPHPSRRYVTRFPPMMLRSRSRSLILLPVRPPP